MAVQKLTDSTYQNEIATGTVLVDFWAEWCGPCRMVSPIVEELAGEMSDVKFAKLNIDENQITAQNLGITSIPTLLLYKNGKPVDKVIGALPKPALKNFIDRNR